MDDDGFRERGRKKRKPQPCDPPAHQESTPPVMESAPSSSGRSIKKEQVIGRGTAAIVRPMPSLKKSGDLTMDRSIVLACDLGRLDVIKDLHMNRGISLESEWVSKSSKT
jgi:hypothetical protein